MFIEIQFYTETVWNKCFELQLYLIVAIDFFKTFFHLKSNFKYEKYYCYYYYYNYCLL